MAGGGETGRVVVGITEVGRLFVIVGGEIGGGVGTELMGWTGGGEIGICGLGMDPIDGVDEIFETGG